MEKESDIPKSVPDLPSTEMEKESEVKDGHQTDLKSVNSGGNMDGIADMSIQTEDGHHTALESESGAGPMEVDQVGQDEEVVVQPACHFGPLLKNSKMPSDCSEQVNPMSTSVKREKARKNILNRSGQFHVVDTSQLMICDRHKNLLGGFSFTNAFVHKGQMKCLWKDHYTDFPKSNRGEKRKRNKKNIKMNNYPFTKEQSEKVLKATGILIPCDSYLCVMCNIKVSAIIKYNPQQEIEISENASVSGAAINITEDPEDNNTEDDEDNFDYDEDEEDSEILNIIGNPCK